MATSAEDTDWAMIASLYDALMSCRPTPIVALNRTIAVAQVQGPATGLAEIEAMADRDRLASYPFYYAALGEFELRREHHAAARNYFERAAALARNAMERSFLERRALACLAETSPQSDRS
jgi:predicted RNA polymerase sigma factor